MPLRKRYPRSKGGSGFLRLRRSGLRRNCASLRTVLRRGLAATPKVKIREVWKRIPRPELSSRRGQKRRLKYISSSAAHALPRCAVGDRPQDSPAGAFRIDLKTEMGTAPYRIAGEFRLVCSTPTWA